MQLTDQKTLWNGSAGRAWVDTKDLLEELFRPFEELLAQSVAPGADEYVLDVGCGTGSTTLAVARRLGPNGRCLGVDISEPMISAAQARAEREGAPAGFVHADVQSYPFESDSFDRIVSRFGVMFFDDPVHAFGNLRRAAKSGGELGFFAWRSAAENPFMITAERSASPLLPNLPARRPGGPGQFAFGDRQRVQTILDASGWQEIDIQPIDVPCTLREEDLMPYLTRMGPVGMHLQEADERTRTEVLHTVRAAFDPYVHGAEVRFTAACWIVRARA